MCLRRAMRPLHQRYTNKEQFVVWRQICTPFQFREIGKQIFGETEERMQELVFEFKRVLAKVGIEVPGKQKISIDAPSFQLNPRFM